jgi:hypothetical protein
MSLLADVIRDFTFLSRLENSEAKVVGVIINKTN